MENQKTNTISPDQLAYNRLCAKNGQLQGQLELVQVNYEFLLQEYAKMKEELDTLKGDKNGDNVQQSRGKAKKNK